MVFWIIAGFIFLFVLLVAGVWKSETRTRILAEKLFSDRTELTEERFHSTYFEKEGIPFEIVSRFRQLAESELGVDLSRLSPEDDFRKNLAFLIDGDSLTPDRFLSAIEAEFEIAFTAEERAKFYRTVQSVIRKIWKKIDLS